MLSKTQKKLITSLQQKKYRNKHGLFIVEGVKSIEEFLKASYRLYGLFSVEDFTIYSSSVQLISENELKQISSLKTPNKALAIFKKPKVLEVNLDGLIVALDGVQDPGNLGTIIGLCDWFGIKQLVCSLDTVDCYNSKVVQSSMGSLCRVQINYLDLSEFIKSIKSEVFGTFMEGEVIYKAILPEKGVIIMGNEGNGITKEVASLVTKKITIPRFGSLQVTESLNVATATAVCLNEFKRNTYSKD